MKRLLKGKGKIGLFISIIALLLLAIVGIFNVETNYDMTQYLPKDSNTHMGLELLEEEFGNYATIQIMIENKTLEEIVQLKQDVAGVTHVLRVIWLDDVANISEGIESVDPVLIYRYYNNQNALLTVLLDFDDYSVEIDDTIVQIRELLSNTTHSIRGTALNNMESRNIAEGEILKILLLILPLCIIILIVASKSWIEPIVILLVLGVGILFNMGTNALLPNVSFITMTLAMALQLALSMDYSLFMVHRFYEELESGASLANAAHVALKKAFPSISASALTTIMGFVALLFMQYRIGFDIGIVLSKGIVFSYLSVVLLMPILLVWMGPALQKTRHKAFIPSISKFTNQYYKSRWIVSILLVIIAVFALVYSNKTSYLYGNQAATFDGGQIQEDANRIQELYGVNNPIVVLVPNGFIESEIQIVQSLMATPNVHGVETLVTVADPTIPRDWIPEQIKNEFIGHTHTRMIVYIGIEEENQTMYDLVEEINQIIAEEYDTYYLIGVSTSVVDIKNTITKDSVLVMIISISAIFLVIMLIFKSFIVPALLIAVIQTSIWMNMAVSYFQDVQVIYIGYLVVMALQLGATIDYAVLLSNRYIEMRKSYNKLDAMKSALKRSTHPIIVSAVVLSVAGFTEGLFSDIKAVQEIGLLIGRGALLSGVMVLLFLPSLLFIFDKLIIKGAKIVK